MGELFKGIGNKLYRVLQLSVQKHFISFFFFQIPNSCSLTQQLLQTRKKTKNKECSKYVFSLWLSSEIRF